MNLFRPRAWKTVTTGLLATSVFLTSLYTTAITTFAAPNTYEIQQEERKLLPVQSNEIADWPQGPAIGAKAAILMEMTTHTVLYAKNIHEKSYPASTTKILTSLIAAQNCSMDERVSFSKRAVYDVPRDASNMGMDAEEEITMEQALYGVLVASANEAASAVGEHVAQKLGFDATPEAFADIMNEKAKELGCVNSHFVNANGLFDENHYTCAYDLALIGCDFFQNEMLCKMSSTPTYHIPQTATQPDDIWISSKNRLFVNREYEYPYLLGSKTGYVDLARQTLVSGAQKDGLKLVCVVFMEETPYQFEDTISLFDYGFSNFEKVSVTEHETKYSVNASDSFATDYDLFGDSSPLLSMEEDSCIIIPKSASFSEVSSSIQYHKEVENDIVATIQYFYSDVPVGTCNILLNTSTPGFSFDEQSETVMTEVASSDSPASKRVVFLNIKYIVLGIAGVALLIALISYLISLISSYNFSPRGQSRRRRRERKKERRQNARKTRTEARTRKRLLRQRKKSYKRRKK